MRGLFSAGICDVMMENDIWPDALVGVSAGAAFGCNYKSRQAGRAIRYNMRFARDARYSGWKSLVTTGNYFNAEFAYHTMPTQLDPFDGVAYDTNPMVFYVVVTDVETGQPVYQRLDKSSHDTYDWIRASASMPGVSRVVELEGRKLLDGGVTDSIPLAFAERIGCQRNIVVLTQPRGYQKGHNKLMPFMRLALRHYPEMVKAMDRRHIMYNQQLDYVAQAEREGRCLAIYPDEPIPIGHVSHDPQRMQQVYQMGRDTALRHLNDIISFYI